MKKVFGITFLLGIVFFFSTGAAFNPANDNNEEKLSGYPGSEMLGIWISNHASGRLIIAEDTNSASSLAHPFKMEYNLQTKPGSMTTGNCNGLEFTNNGLNCDGDMFVYNSTDNVIEFNGLRFERLP